MFFDANGHFWGTISVIFGLLVKFYFGHSVVSIVFSGLLAKSPVVFLLLFFMSLLVVWVPFKKAKERESFYSEKFAKLYSQQREMIGEIKKNFLYFVH